MLCCCSPEQLCSHSQSLSGRLLLHLLLLLLLLLLLCLRLRGSIIWQHQVDKLPRLAGEAAAAAAALQLSMVSCRVGAAAYRWYSKDHRHVHAK
jgi:hypothetical protein